LPVGFTPDEASFGYDAYSLLKTGRDQWGHKLPLVLESFGDFKPPLYAYLTIPSVFFFGLNKFSVRLPNALFGSLAVLVTFLLVSELRKGLGKDFNERKYPRIFSLIINPELLSSFLLAVSPWHIMLSRGAFESNLITFFLPLAIFLFFKASENIYLLPLSSIVFGVSLFSYHSARIVVPLVFTFLFLAFRKYLISKGRYLFVSILISAIFFSASTYTLFVGGARRAQDVIITSGSLEEAAEERILSIYSGIPIEMARIFHNKYLITLRRFVDNYFEYFSFKFLFADGPAEATYGMLPGRGVLSWYELPFILFFLAYFLRGIKVVNKNLIFLVFWVLVSPIPAALTSGRGFAANRASAMMPALQITSALGGCFLFSAIFKGVKDYFKKFLIFLIFLISGFFLFLFFIEDYFFLSPYKSFKAMLYGNLEVVYWLRDNSLGKERVVISTKLSEPHIYVAFANAWNPDDYQKESESWGTYRDQNLKFLDQLKEYRLGKYIFRNINFSSDQSLTKTFLVGFPEEFPANVFVAKRFVDPNGKDLIWVVDPEPQAYAKKFF